MGWSGTEAKSLGSLLRKYRVEQGYSQEALAERAGVSARSIQDLERGLSMPRPETLSRLLNALNLDDAQRRAAQDVFRSRPRRGQLPRASDSTTPAASTGLPTGTVTFLFTDIEGSTRLRLLHPGGIDAAQTRHDELLNGAITGNGGQVFRRTGDGFCAVFDNPTRAVAAAAQAQRSLATERWGEVGQVRVRMGVHTGPADVREGDYVGLTCHRVARIMDAGHGGQVIVSETTAALVLDELPDETVLVDMGVHRLRDLLRAERIFQLRYPRMPADVGDPRTLDAARTNLPEQVTACIGREQLLVDIWDQLSRPDVPSVTLVGPGGTGKTRLAIELGARHATDFADGVWFVALEDLDTAALVAPSIARVVGVPDTAGAGVLDHLSEHLRERAMLLILDNYEHVIDAATVVTHLMRTRGRLKLLITSRSPLTIRGERIVTVPPLELPDSMRLFVERAHAVTGTSEYSDDGDRVIALICERLDNLPLALELAATWTRTLAPAELLARLQRPLSLLSVGLRDASARHQGLRRTIEWSYDLLSASEQALCRRLAVFVGGCTVGAIEAVHELLGLVKDSVLSDLTGVVAQSLVRLEQSPQGKTRLVMLETIHDFAQEQLNASGELPSVKAAHAAYYLSEARRHEREALLQARVQPERHNIRAALRWLTETGDIDRALELAVAMSTIWYRYGELNDARSTLAEILAVASAASVAPPRAMVAEAQLAAGTLARLQADYPAAEVLLRRCVSTAATPGDGPDLAHVQARAAFELASVALLRQQPGAHGLMRDALRRAFAVGQNAVAEARVGAGLVAYVFGDWAEGRRQLEQSIDDFRQLGRRGSQALITLGFCLVGESAFSDARAVFEQVLTGVQQSPSRADIALVACALGLVVMRERNVEHASDLLRQSLDAWQERPELGGIGMTVAFAATVAHALRMPRELAYLLGAAETFRQTYGSPHTLVLQLWLEHILGDLRRDAVDAAEPDFATWWGIGRRANVATALSKAIDVSHAGVGATRVS